MAKESILVIGIAFQLITLYSKGHNFYISSPNEELLTSIQSLHEHLKCPKNQSQLKHG